MMSPIARLSVGGLADVKGMILCSYAKALSKYFLSFVLIIK